MTKMTTHHSSTTLDAPHPVATARIDTRAAAHVDGIHRRFGNVQALNGVTLTVGRGECVALLGPSGCGKTTLLRIIAGLEIPDEGQVWVGGRQVADSGRSTPPAKRGLGMVFQSYALWPHKSVLQNVAFPLTARGTRRSAAAAQARISLAAVNLADHADRRPHELSGGQQQRVALARALVASKDLILFDEPLSNLDVHLRRDMRREVRRLQDELGFSSLWVTHDQEEAMAIADRVAVMRHGEVLACDTPAVLFERPPTSAVARFLGDTNVVPVTVNGHVARWEAADWSFDIDYEDPSGTEAVIRASDVDIHPQQTASDDNAATVTDVEYEGGAHYVLLEQASTPLRALGYFPDVRPADQVTVTIRRAWLTSRSPDQAMAPTESIEENQP